MPERESLDRRGATFQTVIAIRVGGSSDVRGPFDIYAFKLGLTLGMSNEEYEYTFNVAEALGANHITMELPEDGALTKRVGEFAAKRKMYVGYHAHTQATPTIWDQALSQSKYNGINLDLGHYTAGTSGSSDCV